MGWKRHVLRVGSVQFDEDDIPDERDFRKDIEPWLSAVFQSEHLSVLVGSGLTTAVAAIAKVSATSMSLPTLDWSHASETQAAAAADLDRAIADHATTTAKDIGRGAPNIEDHIRSAMTLLAGLEVLRDERHDLTREALRKLLASFLSSLLRTEASLRKQFDSRSTAGLHAQQLLVSFLLSFASRTASRERVNVFTTNYDRLIEVGCDLAGLRVLDRFVGILQPIFRASRVDVDIHYNPPGIRGEPRYLEGVIRLSKLHGSLDWRSAGDEIFRVGLPFGAPVEHPDIPSDPIHTVMIYPNAAKDVETFEYPYAEIFRDFSAATCRPNSALVTYGYGFGDDHINRVLRHMLTLPSTHLVIISFGDPDGRIVRFHEEVGRSAQISLLLGPHFAGLETLVERYLPKAAVDLITIRQADLRARRGRPSDPERPEGLE